MKTKSVINHLVFTLCALFSFCLGDVSAREGFELVGSVIDVSGNPVPGAVVTAICHDWEETSVTGAGGGFSFGEFPCSSFLTINAEVEIDGDTRIASRRLLDVPLKVFTRSSAITLNPLVLKMDTAKFTRPGTANLHIYRAEVSNFEAAKVFSFAISNNLVSVDYCTYTQDGMSLERPCLKSFGIYQPQNSKRIYLDSPDLVVENSTVTVAPGREDFPCTDVSWFGTHVFCNAKSLMDGMKPYYDTEDLYPRRDIVYGLEGGWRLPSSLGWEKAARGGLENSLYPNGDAISHQMANYVDSEDGQHPVWPRKKNPLQYFAPNGYGLYGMAGNVSEMIDFKSSGLVQKTLGGGFESSEEDLECASRGRTISPTAKSDSTGFRIMRSMPHSHQNVLVAKEGGIREIAKVVGQYGSDLAVTLFIDENRNGILESGEPSTIVLDPIFRFNEPRFPESPGIMELSPSDLNEVIFTAPTYPNDWPALVDRQVASILIQDGDGQEILPSGVTYVFDPVDCIHAAREGMKHAISEAIAINEEVAGDLLKETGMKAGVRAQSVIANALGRALSIEQTGGTEERQQLTVLIERLPYELADYLNYINGGTGLLAAVIPLASGIADHSRPLADEGLTLLSLATGTLAVYDDNLWSFPSRLEQPRGGNLYLP